MLVEVAHLPLDLMDKISMRFKVMSNLVTYQAGMPQDGTAVGGPGIGRRPIARFDLPTTRGGEDRRCGSSIRATGASSWPRSGFEESTLQRAAARAQADQRAAAVHRTDRSGKTSTMYSSLCHIIQREGSSISISTVEDPVEFNLPMVSQTQINSAQELTYAMALRSIMRQDPQVILVGEIRDPETAAIAVQAGLTGHLVISTIHRGVSAGAFTRLINMQIEPFMLASSVLAVMGLRLVRRVCPALRRSLRTAPQPAEAGAGRSLAEAQFHRGVGCDQCTRTGFSGRLPVSELLVADEPFREAVLKKVPTSALEEIAIQQGMRTLWQNGLSRALTGQSTLEEIIRVVAADMV